MSMHEVTLSITCDSDGGATVDGTKAILGKLYAIQYTATNLDAGTDIVVSTQNSRGAKTLLTCSPAASALYYPRDLVHTEAGAAMTGVAGGDRCLPLLDGTPRVVVLQGGDKTTGFVTLYYTED